MIGLALAFVLQTAPIDAFAAEGETLGRMTPAINICTGLGYGDNQAMARRLDIDLKRRVLEAGQDLDAVMAAVRTGMYRERRDLRIDEDEDLMSTDQLRLYATETISRVKRRCREMADERPGMITDLDSGDQVADAHLASILRTLDDRSASESAPH